MPDIQNMNEFSFKFSDVVGNSLNTSVTDTKDKLDLQPRELRNFILSLVNILNSIDGADYLHAKGYDGLKTTIQAMLNDLNSRKADLTRLQISENNIVNLQSNKADLTRLIASENNITNLRNNKVDQGGNFTGTWQGLRPSQVEPGLSSLVDSHTAQLNDIVNNVKLFLNNKIPIEKFSELKKRAYTTLDGSKKVTTNGVTVWEPDGSATYNAFWTRDFAYMVQGCIDYFTAQEIESVFRYIAGKCNTATYEVPDHISVDGTVYWTPGSDNTWGQRAALDGNFFLIDIIYNLYKMTGSTSLYNEYKAFLKNIIDIGIPYNPTTGCVYVNPSMTVATYGFWDTVKMTGDIFFLSVLAYNSYKQLSEMATKNGENSDSVYYKNKAEKIKSNLDQFWCGSFLDNSSNGFKGNVGLYKASTGLCKDQLDVWGSAMAVFYDAVSEERKIAISKYLANTYVNNKSNLFYLGGIRHVPKSNEYVANTHVWEAYIYEPTFGTYQNGGFWTTPSAWVCYTVALTDLKSATDIMEEGINNHILIDSNAPYEWLSESGTKGVTKYTANATLPLLVLESAKIFNSNTTPTTSANEKIIKSAGNFTNLGETQNITACNLRYVDEPSGKLTVWGNATVDTSISANTSLDLYIKYPLKFKEKPSISFSALPGSSWTGFGINGYGIDETKPLERAMVHISNGSTAQVIKSLCFTATGISINAPEEYLNIYNADVLPESDSKPWQLASSGTNNPSISNGYLTINTSGTNAYAVYQRETGAIVAANKKSIELKGRINSANGTGARLSLSIYDGVKELIVGMMADGKLVNLRSGTVYNLTTGNVVSSDFILKVNLDNVNGADIFLNNSYVTNIPYSTLAASTVNLINFGTSTSTGDMNASIDYVKYNTQ